MDTWTQGKVMVGPPIKTVTVTCFSACIDECKKQAEAGGDCQGVNVEVMGDGILQCQLMAGGDDEIMTKGAAGFYYIQMS